MAITQTFAYALLIKITFTLLAYAFIGNAYSAEVTLVEGITSEIKVAAIIFKGKIQKGDYNSVLEQYNKINDKKLTYIRLVVSTKGGSIDEALKIGTWLRGIDVELFIPPGHECSSACIYILAGAKKRYVMGKIGIHRPYLTDDPQTDIGTYMRTILDKSRKYFDVMNIPPDLADDMFSIAPENVHYLSHYEAKKYRLNDSDFGQKEEDNLKIAKSLGVSRQEWMIYSSAALNRCEKYKLLADKKYADCYIKELNALLEQNKLRTIN